MNYLTVSPHPTYTSEPQGRAVDLDHVPTSYYGATPVPASEHSGGQMLSHGNHPDLSAWQIQPQANDGVAHSFHHPPATYWPPNTHTAQAPIPRQYSHTLQSVNAGTPGPAFYQEMRSTVMPTSTSPTQGQVSAPYGGYYYGQVDSAASAATQMSSAATWSQLSGETAHSTYHRTQGIAMDTSTAYPYGQSFTPSAQAAAAATYAAPSDTASSHVYWAQPSGVTDDTRGPALASSAQPQNGGLSLSIPTHDYVEPQGVSEARQLYAAPILPVVFHSYHDGPRMSITVELYPRSEMPVASSNFHGLC
ncbi:hypothetical protein HETIRDRAFT_100558 [Heterobasidion irregulare TC 32-1]|uniref:Uncharacterized protein n=1 Tax=Heterobasidion irregulare (strain TC 32-1) TaxID=747525 RepID=W4KJJ6_HETIT|nr:uncharacterized protein HETIRDRAFT_100558 [Heterobasidion irregulare TC 32-1]ETW85864.1 hypothetical protein HETIRDRAFT_100558 [Heterobasidion irregulare TC 32-1]